MWMVWGFSRGQRFLQGQGRRRMCMWQAKKINKTCEDAAVLLFATFTFATRSRRLLAGQAASDVVLQPPFFLLCHLFGLQLNLLVYVVLQPSNLQSSNPPNFPKPDWLPYFHPGSRPPLCAAHQHTLTCQDLGVAPGSCFSSRPRSFRAGYKVQQTELNMEICDATHAWNTLDMDILAMKCIATYLKKEKTVKLLEKL